MGGHQLGAPGGNRVRATRGALGFQARCAARYAAGQLAVHWMRGMEFSVAQGVLPALDGKFELRDFRLRREAGQADKPCSECSQDAV